MHAVAARMQVVLGVARVQGDVAGRVLQCLVDHRRRKAHAPVIGRIGRAIGRHGRDAAFGGQRYADLVEDLVRRRMDALYLIVGEGFVAAPFHARADRAGIGGERCGAGGLPRGAASGTAAGGLLKGGGHGSSPWDLNTRTGIETAPQGEN